MGSSGGLDPRTPVIVGAGQVLQRPAPDGGGALDPIGLAVAALRIAGEDSGTGERLLRRADSVRHVATSGWLYSDEAALVSEALGAAPRERVRSAAFGGDGPGRLVGDAARAIAAGEADVVLIAGAEAVASLLSVQRAGGRPSWPEQPSARPTRVVGTERAPANEAEQAVGLLAPSLLYALMENAIRAERGAGRDQHVARISELWSGFSRVAARNPHAWIAREHSAREIATPGPRNRPVADPYTKLMSANIAVDQAAALILCSARAAIDAGVPRERWVFPLASAHAADEWFVSERSELAASPAIAAASRAALEHAGASIWEVAQIDLYSCFPSAVQIAARELGLDIADPGRPLSVTGGLTFAGGPGNDYALHAIATLVERLRAQPDALGLSTALGWYATKHACGVYSASPPRRPFREIDAGASMARPAPRAATAAYEGPARIESFTVPYRRDGSPEALIASAITPDGARALVREDEPERVAAILEADPLGAEALVVAGAGGRIELGAPATLAAGAQLGA
ncbi:MAG: acetyl-CoA acetyltransferase [Acidobacteriota bacterium]|nr:acetyl-CoA acetyltransferase [Acidobacteriota bacterium]